VTVDDVKRVYKESCYYLRQPDDFNKILIQIDKKDQQKPPPKELLKLLGEPYSNWVCKEYAGGWIVVLEYDFILGGHGKVTMAAWKSLLRLIKTLHDNDYVHGDILPRNMLFFKEEGYIIDFDLMKKEGEPYVKGYNYDEFVKYRHPDTMSKKLVMEKKHDIHALVAIGTEYFGDKIDSDKLRKTSSIDGLIEFFAPVASEEKSEDYPEHL
jgi:serine/threonine protein kinase